MDAFSISQIDVPKTDALKVEPSSTPVPSHSKTKEIVIPTLKRSLIKGIYIKFLINMF